MIFLNSRITIHKFKDYNYFEQFQQRENDTIEPYARVLFPFPGKPFFERHVLGWQGTGQKVFFVTVSAPDRH